MSQSMLDYTRNEQGLRALETTFVTVLFKHGEGLGLREAVGRHGLTQAERDFLVGAPTPGEGQPAHALLCTHRGKKPVKIVPSPLELHWKRQTVADATADATGPAAGG